MVPSLPLARFLTLIVPLVACGGGTAADDWVYEEPEQCPIAEGIGFVAPAVPNIMLTVDASGSMGFNGGWDALMAMTPYLSGVEAASNLGLTLFPGNDECDARVAVPVSSDDDVDDQIMDVLAATTPSGSTPVGAAIDLIATEGHMQDPYRENVVVLLTDGQPSCDDGPLEAVTDLVAMAEPVKLHILGFGDGAAGAADTLQELAAAAEVTTGPDNYYQAESVEALLGRLDAISAALEPCAFVLDEEVSAEDLLVWINGVAIDACTDDACEEGYSYDEESGAVRFTRMTCRTLGTEACPDVVFDRED
jgi:von Willebrand factor type A domain